MDGTGLAGRPGRLPEPTTRSKLQAALLVLERKPRLTHELLVQLPDRVAHLIALARQARCFHLDGGELATKSQRFELQRALVGLQAVGRSSVQWLGPRLE
eukprot:1135835-Prymnesium_polylepis.2